MTLKERIRQRMEEKHWSLADLAKETNIAKGYLWEILKGEAQRPSANTLYAIAIALGTSVADLLGKEDELNQESDRNIPLSLKEFAHEIGLPKEDIKMLANIRFRGEQPKDKEGWRFLYESIKRSTRG